MSDDNLFAIDTEQTPTIDETVDYLETLVGEGKKFKDAKELAKGKAHADLTIEVMKTKLDALNQQLAEAKSLEAVLTEIRSQKENQVQQQPVITPDPEPNADSSTIEAKLEELLARREAAKAAETNKEYVNRVLTESIGDVSQVRQVLSHKAKELGMTGQALEALAHQNPKAFFKLLDVQEGPRQGAAPIIPQNRQISTQENGIKRGASYYEKMKRENPKLYFDPKTTVQMINDMRTLGRDEYHRS